MASEPDRSPAAVDALLTRLLAAEDEDLMAATRAPGAAGLPAISVTALEGRLLELLARAIGARRILELGTLAGYSTIFLARALAPGGRLVTIEHDPGFAEVARANVARAGLAGVVDLRVGDALAITEQLDGPFDLAFLDADKATLPEQLDLVIPRVRAGGLVVCDNVVREGTVAAPGPDDRAAAGVRRALERLGGDARVEVTAIQTAGAKGRDGFALALVR